MTKITINAEMMAKLHPLTEPTELCDESGKTLGYFHPVASENGLEGQCRSPFSDEELQKRRQQRTGRTLAEILARLEQS